VTAQAELEAGIKSYEEGDYKSADKQLQSALDMGLAGPLEVARAHKYRAFMVCVSGREKVCRDEVRKALEVDPSFALAPAEAGHPVWSQVVRSVKAEMAKAKPKAPAK
jgi:Tfp pilus assembly protein PilF